MGKKVLITGASGFVGSCIARRMLLENYEVHITARETSNLWRLKDILKDLNIHNTNLMDNESVKNLARNINVDLVFHLATYGGTHYENKIDSIINTNLLGTWNLFSEFAKKDIDMFINTSSSSEYGEKTLPMSEDMMVEPNNMYGASKASATILCNTFAKVNKIPLVTLRLFSPYGYFDTDTRLIPTVITSCILNKEIKLAKKESRRDFIFIDDIIDAYLSIQKLSGCFGEVYNIGSGLEYSVEQIVNTITGKIKNDSKIVWGNELKRQYEPKMWVSDSTRVANEVGWKPKTTIEEGLTKTIEWFRNNIYLYK